MTQIKGGHPPKGAGEEKRTFLPYSRGIPVKDLRVGSLFLDPVNPVGGDERKRFEYREKTEQKDYEKRVSQYCYGEEPVDNFSMNFWKHKNSNLSFSLTELVQLNFSKDKFEETSIAGTVGRRVQLKKPRQFIEKDVLVQDELDEWLRIRASANRAVYAATRRNKVAWTPPQIWVCTGVQIISEGKVYTGKELESLKELQLTLDASQAVGAPEGLLSAGGGFSRGQGHGTSEEYTYKNERIWAAEFMELGIVYGSGEQDGDLTVKCGEAKPKLVKTVEIYDTPTLGEKGVRGGEEAEEWDMEEDNIIPESEQTHAHFFVVGSAGDTAVPVQFGSHVYVGQLDTANWAGFNTGMEYLKHKKVPVATGAGAARACAP